MAVKVVGLLQPVLVLGHATHNVVRGSGQLFFVQGAQRVAHGILIQIHERIAIGFLVARIDERIQRKRIILGRGEVFFHQRAQYPGFYFAQNHIHVTESYNTKNGTPNSLRPAYTFEMAGEP